MLRKNKLVPSGKRHYMYKYTDEQVKEICKLLEKKNNNTMREIATLTNTTYNFAVSIKTHKAHNDISNKYNIDNYTVKQPITDKSKYYNRNHAVSFDDNKLHTVCKLLSENELTVKEIAILTGLSKSTVYKIKHKDFKLKHYKDIMNLYNYNTYNKR